MVGQETLSNISQVSHTHAHTRSITRRGINFVKSGMQLTRQTVLTQPSAEQRNETTDYLAQLWLERLGDMWIRRGIQVTKNSK